MVLALPHEEQVNPAEIRKSPLIGFKFACNSYFI